MAKQLNVDLNVRANTSQAKNSLMELQGVLSKIAIGNIGGNLDPTKMKQASMAAKELSIHLNNAFNAQTGNFDLSKLDRSLKTSKQNITQLSTSLLGAGSTGQQAFTQLAQTIAQADRPLISLSSKLTGLMTTLKNTARWQLSSSLLHGFVGAISNAYRYAEDLNESLNNIRIVTGQNTDQMAKFAKEANKAAKVLSTTTTEYTNASLIFYQQGLSDEEVKKRTDVTIKMANAAGQSAETVSDQLTAVWNNFYDGTKSLEYYADVMTALGAATASSTDEIAGGLEKFAAIGETIGLSYEYAASALATITANTRQSEDVVGTALKTIFARIQGLNLGETLDDGTTLNKYSQALEKVGISIFEQNGELKAMDNILDEMGSKWDALSKAQQTALAQTVAGVRQYTQLVALMDNWNANDSDSMKANLNTAYGSEGTLQQQADIYAESWEAASERVAASAQAIYSDLIDDKFFINLYNGFSGLLDSIDAFIDGIGGVKGVLLALGSFFLSSITTKIQPALLNLQHTFTVMFQSATQQAKNITAEMSQSINNALKTNNFNDSQQIALKNSNMLAESKARISVVEKNLTEIEKQRYNQELAIFQIQQNESQTIADNITKRKEEIALLNDAFDYEKSALQLSNARAREEERLIQQKKEAELLYLNDSNSANKTNYTHAISELNEHRAATERLINAREQYAKSLYDSYTQEMQATQGSIQNSQRLLNIQEMMPEAVNHYVHALQGMQNSKSVEHQKETFFRLKTEIEQIVGTSCPQLTNALDKAMSVKSPQAFKKHISQIIEILKTTTISAKDLDKILIAMGQGKNVSQLKNQYKALNQDIEKLKQKQLELNKTFEQFNPTHTVTGIERITSMAAGFGQVAMAATSLKSFFDAWGNEDLSFGEKLTTSLMSISMLVPSVMGALKNLNTAILGNSAVARIAVREHDALLGKLALEETQTTLTSMAKGLYGTQQKQIVATSIAENLVKKGLVKEEEKEAFATFLAEKAQEAKSAEDLKAIIIDKLEIDSKTKLNKALKSERIEMLKNIALKVGKFVAAHPLAIAAVAALTAAIVIAIKAYKAEGEALKSAQEGVRNAAAAYQDLKQKYDDLKASIDDYHNTKTAFEELEKGAEGYQEALNKANEAARKLIETNNLFDDWHYDENGLIVIDEDALTEAELAAQNRVNSASMNVAAANIKLNETKKDIATPWWLEDTASEQLLGSINSEVFTSIKDAVDRGVAYTDLNAEDLGLTTSELNRLIVAIGDLGDKAESTYQELTSLNQSNEYYAEQLALGSVQTNGIGSDVENEDQRNAYQKAYANLLAQDDNYIKQLEENADKAKKATNGELKRIMRDMNKDNSDSLMNKATTGGLNDEELMRLYIRDVQGWSEQDAKAAVYEKGTGKGTLKLGDKTVTYKDQQMRNELYTKYLADEMAANLKGSDYNQDEIKAILDSVTALPDTNKGEVSSGETELLNALMNYKEGETVSVNWGELTPEEYEQFSEQINTMAANNANDYAAAFSEQLISPEAQQLMYENLQAQKEAAEIEAIFAEGAEATEVSTAALESYAESLMSVNEMTDDQRVLAAKVAVQHAKLAKGLNKIQDIYNDNIDVLKEADESSLDYHEAVGKLSEALTETFGMKVSPSFVKNAENLENIGKAAKGDVVALNELRKAINADFVANLDLQTDGASEALTAELNRLSEEALNNPIGTELTLNDDKAIAALNEALYTGKATIEDIEAMFNNANLAMPEYKTQKVPGEVTTTTSTAHYKGPLGIEWDVTSTTDTTTERTIPYFGDQAPSIDDSGNMNYGGGGTDISVSSSGNTASLSDAIEYEGDGGNSSSSGKDYKPEKERYHEINEQIKDQEQLLNKLSKAKDKAFGANRLKIMDDEIAAQEEMLKKQEALLAEQEAYLVTDKQKVIDTFGSKAQFDENGNLTNYNELLLSTTNEEQAKILKQYEDTNNAIQEQKENLEELRDTIQDLHFDKLNYKLELNLDLDESELKKLDYYLDKYSDDFAKMADSLELMIDKLDVHTGSLANYKNYWDNLKTAYAEGKINQDQYVEGLKTVEDGMYGDLEALNQLEKEIKNFYEETLSEATAELEDHTDHMEHLTSVFDHYLTLMELTGRSKDFDAMGDFLGGKAQTIKDRLDVENKYYETLLAQQKEVQAEYEKALKSGDEDKIKAWKKNLDAITDEVDAAHKKVLSSTEEWVEVMKAVYENDLAKAADTLEKALTGGVGFEVLMDGFDKLNARQEEFLTKTNQIYETDKLMRTAHQALDKTDNAVSKQKLKNFIDETKALQENTQLSKYELEIQQAKYDLLIAEMALEEAKNAKSTVRLQRDSEGNFGYVYTADQDAINNAEQNYYDAQNRLYNISLEGQQEYTEKFLQAQQDMFNELAELDKLRAEGTIATDEELMMRRKQVLAHYMDPVNGILTQYSNLYNIAIQTDSKATADYWAADYGNMTQNTEEWKTAVNGYFTEVDTATKEWKTVSEEANKIVKKALDDSATATKNLTDESEDLRDEINDEVIPALESELKEVDELTAGFLNQQKQIEQTRLEYEAYLKTLGTEIKTNSQQIINSNLANTPETPTTAPTTPAPASTTTAGGGGGNGGNEGNGGMTGGGGDGETEKPWMFRIANKGDNATLYDSACIYPSKTEAQTAGNNYVTNTMPELRSFTKVETYQQDSVPGKVQAAPRSGSGDLLSNDPPLEEGDLIRIPKGSVGYRNPDNPNFFNKGTAVGTIETKVVAKKTVGGTNWYQWDDTLKGTGLWWMTENNLQSYDTGGYTGDWGPEGKLAMLHQKELVLNSDDTSNILQTVSFIRDVVGMIDHNAASASLGGMFATPYFSSGGSSIEQDIKIYAEFPSATNHTEIEEAFNNLLNTASQYANRKI